MKKIFRPNIIKIKYYYDEKRKTKCVINWIDANNTRRRSVGVALRNPNDDPNLKLGKHIAESRAKADMFRKHIESLDDIYLIITYKRNIYGECHDREILHINDLTNHES